MKLSEYMKIDTRDRSQTKLLVDKFLSIPGFQDVDLKADHEHSIEKISRKLAKVERVTGLKLTMIMSGFQDFRYYSFYISGATEKSSYKAIYSKTLLEGYMKTVIYMYYYYKMKKGKKGE